MDTLGVNILNLLKKDAESAVFDWLRKSTTDYKANHEAARALFQEGTGRWLTEGEIFKNWIDGENPLIWIQGIRMCPHSPPSFIALVHIH